MILLEPSDGGGNMTNAATIAVLGVLFGNAPHLTGIVFDRAEIILYHAFLITIAYLSYRGKNKKKK